ncbi:ADP-ribosylation factor-related protein 1 isoform X2 [Pteropus alecto]|uniref:ADP-ribosylation factor-related protein 1 isoform X2 n=1 Tax=Pteropus alecto TaxID=9402 RepID=UPI000D537C88|nr:ADP-ribosylation factor-related protein 1 isoform X2 [Pteropus alecto]
MYTLLSGLYKYMFRKDEYCVLILGLDNAGKTTFLEQSKTRFNKNYKAMSFSKITTTSARWTWGRLGSCSGTSVGRKSCSLCGTSTMPSAMASSTSSIPPMKRDCRSPSEPSRRWLQVKLWVVSPSLCWPTSRMSSQGVREGIEWMVKCVVRNVHRPPRQRDIT